MIPKHNYIRSTKLLREVAQLECQSCGSGYGTQAAHTNWGGGKGRGIKADDNLIAALCQTCHYEIDQGANLSKEQRQQLWLKAHHRTVRILLEMNKWPSDVPIPRGDIWLNSEQA
jgi:hypothetical protein